jgi:hypothetical protein
VLLTPGLAVAQPAPDAKPTFVIGKFTTTLYGWLQGDFIHDTQRVAVDSYGGNPNLFLHGTQNTQNGDMGRTVLSARSTRLGLRFAVPATEGVKVSGLFEMDFLGNQPGTPPRGSTTPSITEQAFLIQPTPRLRQAHFKLDTPYISLLVGQAWSLFGFQGSYLPTSVQNQGLPGQLFARNPQFRLSRIFDTAPLSVEVAAAVQRSPQFDSEFPDLHGGVRLTAKGWTGLQNLGGTTTFVAPASIAVAGLVRQFKLATSLTTNDTTTATGSGISVNALLPVIPATQRGGFALSLLGEFVNGTGISDMFLALNGGVLNIGQPAGIPAASYAPFQDLDFGLGAWTSAGDSFQTIDWRTALVGAQLFYGPVIVAANYSNVYSGNSYLFSGNTWTRQWFADGVVLVDVTSGVRLGAEFARVMQTRNTGAVANNSRFQFTGWFLF